MFKYSYDALVYFGEEITKGIERVARCGYDAIELIGEPESYTISEINKRCKEVGISVSSICSIYDDRRDLASPEADKRKIAVDYVKQIAEFSAEVGAPVMIVAPSACMKTSPWKDPDEERKWVVEGIREGALHAQKLGVDLCIEAWNRYETYFMNRIDQCLDLMKEIDLPNIGVMGDTFHMNIEDPDIGDAFRLAGKNLIHVHLADSNRAAPGQGHIDFFPVLKALKEINYSGHLTFELLPASADPFGTLRKGGGRDFFDEYTKSAIEYIKNIEKKL